MTFNEEQQIKQAHFELPDQCRRTPATAEDLASFEREFGSIPIDYRWYLAECGGGVIGSEWIDGIQELPRTHRKVRQEQPPGFHNFFPIGWDGAGNPYGFNLETGRIVSPDHDLGGIHEVALDFYDLLCKKGLIR